MIPVVVRGRLGGKGASWLSPAHAELLNAQGVAVGVGVVRRSPAGLFAHISGAGVARRARPVNVLHAYEDPLTTHGPRRGRGWPVLANGGHISNAAPERTTDGHFPP